MLFPSLIKKKAIRLFALLFMVSISVSYAQLPVEMLLVGGGGGGGRNAGSNSSGGGGGGGGQVLYATATYSTSDILTVTVGSGGNGYRNSPLVNQTDGSSSSLTGNPGTWTAVGGHAGGNATSTSSSGTGGASVNSDLSGAGGRGGIRSLGNNTAGWPVKGGDGNSTYFEWGAATATGQLASGVYYYAGGGAGGNWGGQSGGTAAAGLGGAGTSNTDATGNTGGGGGGANSNGSSGMGLPGGNGGSGLIIIRYLGTPVATGGTIVTTGGYTYHTFTSSGTLTVNSTLPVNWVSFTAKPVSGNVQLNWVVASETNNLRYDIQRSADGVTYNTLGSLNSQLANSITNTSYVYADVNPLNGFSYYRIKQVDLDGHFSYSSIVSVRDNIVGGIIVGPNPIKTNIQISIPAVTTGMYECRIFNTEGALLQNTMIGHGNNSINVRPSAHGIYILTLWQNGSCIYRKELIK